MSDSNRSNSNIVSFEMKYYPFHDDLRCIRNNYLWVTYSILYEICRPSSNQEGGGTHQSSA